MKEQATQTKAAKGSVGIEEFRGKLRLRLPRQIFGGKQKYVSTGLEDTPENRKRARDRSLRANVTPCATLQCNTPHKLGGSEKVTPKRNVRTANQVSSEARGWIRLFQVVH